MQTENVKRKMLSTMILDGSTSMADIHGMTIDGANSWIENLAGDQEADIRASLVIFNSMGFRAGARMTKLREAVRPAEFAPLTRAEYPLAGSTPLFDAIASTIRSIETATMGRPDILVSITIQTDGKENDSRTTKQELAQMISAKTELGWQFQFMGCGIDAYLDGHSMGLNDGAIINYGKTQEMTRSVFTASADNLRAYAAGHAANTCYSDMQKFHSGDRK